MSEFVPLYLLPLSDHAVSPRTGAAAKALVDAAAESPEESGLRTDVSGDWWHPRLVAALCRACSIGGLGFLLQDLRVLSAHEAAEAAAAVDKLLSRLESGAVPGEVDACGAQWSVVRGANLAEVIQATVPCVAVDAQNGEAETLIEFLVAIQLACGEVVERQGRLLYYSPEA